MGEGKHMDSHVDANDVVKIKVPKGNGRSDSVINGSINGQPYTIAVDQEVEVPRAVAEAIGNSGLNFEVVDGDGEGLSASSTAPLTDTASRQKPAIPPESGDSNQDAMKPVPTLEGGDGDSGQSGSSVGPQTEPEFDEGQQNAEGQGVASTGGARVGNDTTGNANTGSADGGSEGGKADNKVDEEKPETVAALKERIAKINDVDQLRAEHDAEQNGAKRTSALAAIDQRIDAIQESK